MSEDKAFKLIHAFNEAKKKTDENPFLFKCPNCGNEAKGGYIEGNGHIRVECSICKIRILE